LSNVSLCDEEDDPLEWMLFGTREEEMSPTQELPDCDENSFIWLQGLHWETDNTIEQRSSRVMNYKSSEVHDDYKHLFTSPIDSMFAVIPLVFWEVLLEEVNRYANGYIRSKKKEICMRIKMESCYHRRNAHLLWNIVVFNALSSDWTSSKKLLG
jgi:hypothetical protein